MPGGRAGFEQPGRLTVAGRTGRPGQAPPGAAGAGADRAEHRPLAERPVITVEEAMAELDSMIGLAAVKEQVRSISASIEAARIPGIRIVRGVGIAAYSRVRSVVLVSKVPIEEIQTAITMAPRR